MRIGIRQLRYAVMVADESGFCRAAEKLHIAQPAVSRAVRNLELELGFDLFTRNTRNVSTTDAGAAFLRDARKVLKQLDSAIRGSKKIADGYCGQIFVGYSTLAIYGPMSGLIMDFRSEYPEIEVGMRLMSTDETIVAIDQGGVDVGFVISTGCNPRVANFPVWSENFVVLAPVNHRLAGQDAIEIEELAKEPFVMGSTRRWRPYRDFIDGLFIKHGFIPNIVEEADDVPVLLALIVGGYGITIYPASIAPYIGPDLTAIPICGNLPDITMSLAWDPVSETHLVRNFLDYVDAHIKRQATGR